MSLALLQEAATTVDYGAFAAIGAGLAAIGAGIGNGRYCTSTRNARKNPSISNCYTCLR